MQETAKASERRRVPRISVDLPATVTWSRKRRPWRARELSEFGVFLAPKRKEPAKEKGTKEQGTKEKGAKEEATIKEREEVLVDLGLEPKTSPLSLAIGRCLQEKTAGDLFAVSPRRLHEFRLQPFKKLVELSKETIRVIQIQGTAGWVAQCLVDLL